MKIRGEPHKQHQISRGDNHKTFLLIIGNNLYLTFLGVGVSGLGFWGLDVYLCVHTYHSFTHDFLMKLFIVTIWHCLFRLLEIQRSSLTINCEPEAQHSEVMPG